MTLMTKYGLGALLIMAWLAGELQRGAHAQGAGKIAVIPWVGFSYKNANGSTVDSKRYDEKATSDVVETESESTADDLNVEQKLGVVAGYIFPAGWLLGLSMQRDLVVTSAFAEEYVSITSQFTGSASRYSNYDYTQEIERTIAGVAFGYVGTHWSHVVSYYFLTQAATSSDLKLYDSSGNILAGQQLITDYAASVFGWRYDLNYRWPFGWFDVGGGVSFMRTAQVSDTTYDMSWLITRDDTTLPAVTGTIRRQQTVIETWPFLSLWCLF